MPACSSCTVCSCKQYPQLSKPFICTPKEIMVIGETLTAVEARKGICMSGPAVAILQQTMAKVGLPIDTSKVHYTVAVACAVPRKKGKQFPKEPMMNCRYRLFNEIKAVKPKIIIVLGKVALQTLTGNYSIKVTEYYGRAEILPEYIGTQHMAEMNMLDSPMVIPVMHPALIMRAPGDYKPFYASLQLIASIYHGGSTHDTGETQWQILETDADCDRAVKFLSKFPKVAADMETTSLDYREAEFCVVGICFAKNKVLIIPRSMRHRMKDFFALPNLRWTWHHGKYDRKVMWRRKLTVFDKEGWHIFPHQDDTIYMHYVLDETSAHDLGYLTKTYLQAAEYKYKMNQQFKAVTLETYNSFFDALCERVAVDADYTFQLEEVLWAEICKPENESLKRVYSMLIMPAASFLARVEQNGMLTDEDFLHDLDSKYEILLKKILADVQEAASPFWDREMYMTQSGAKSSPVTFNPGSPKQMSWMVFSRLKLKPKRRKGTSTDADVLESIEEDIPLIKKVLEYRGVAKERSTYVIGNLKRRDIDGRVRSNFSLHITATGRLSSKEPNVQNLPSANGVGNVRQAFIPEKGKILMEVDYSGAELRWLAFLSNCPVLRDVFTSGRNLHKETATALFGSAFTQQQKMRAKAVNFGIPYGREAPSFKDEFGITLEEAQKMIDDWLNNYHGARDYLNWCADQVLLGNYLQTPWGNRRRAGLVTPESLHNLQNEFKNFPIQGSSSHTLLYSAIKVERPLKKEFNSTIIDLIHDSMLIEVPKDKQTVQAVSQYVSEEMRKTPIDLFNCDIPFVSDTDVGPDWGNLEAYNNKTGNMEIEHKEKDKKPWIEIIPYTDWIESVYHYELYERNWYKQLKHL